MTEPLYSAGPLDADELQLIADALEVVSPDDDADLARRDRLASLFSGLADRARTEDRG